MKKIVLTTVFLFFLANSFAQNFKYAFVSDTHVGATTGEEDLRRTVADINQQKDLDFVVLTGDITEMGTNDELKFGKINFIGFKNPVLHYARKS